MDAFEAVVERESTRKPIWKYDAFWIVGVPTSLIALVFALALVVRAAGA